MHRFPFRSCKDETPPVIVDLKCTISVGLTIYIRFHPHTNDTDSENTALAKIAVMPGLHAK